MKSYFNKAKMTDSIGKLKIPAQSRGEITRLSGSTPIISILDNCSVAFIKPISAVNAEPARPAKAVAHRQALANPAGAGHPGAIPPYAGDCRPLAGNGE